ncbi:MAG: TVP38/TMEM64 family protein [Desulfobulbaceae bacterium]|nr:TVP38/TMEM64 family protein [Desulfobulbaceae bacterium]
MNKNVTKKLAIVLAIIVLVAAFKLFGFGDYLTLDYLKQSQYRFADLYSAKPMLVISSYMAIYILVTALSLPGAAIMTLAGGGLFGLIPGTIIVSFASTIGATLACFVSRFLLRDWVQNKFGEKLETINRGIENEGGFYLFTMRLVPAFPFFLINLAMGVTKLPLLQYYWVSQLGMLPGTIVYVNAGKELAKIDSLSGILSPSLLISFAILGIFPITVKKIMARVKMKKG